MGRLQIRGTAHPAPARKGARANPADLSAAEIRGTNLGGLPLLCEHDRTDRIGTCLTSWTGADGSLRLAAEVDDPTVAKQIRSGEMRGLSLGTSMLMGDGGGILFRGQEECSVCVEGKR